MKTAILSMDVEDWYHLDYFDRKQTDETYSMLDGLDKYHELLDRHGIPSTFFVLGELARGLAPRLCELASAGHEIASHGWDHQRPLTLSTDTFRDDLLRSKHELEDVVGQQIDGYRAPCFSLDRERLDLVRDAGYRYDSSRIDFASHPLYGTIDLDGFQQAAPWVYQREDFCEFQVTTKPMAGRQLPISGGGYLRIFPWLFMRRWVGQHACSGEVYVLYIHPFELSSRRNPTMPAGTRWQHRLRFGQGRNSVANKLDLLIQLLQNAGYSFATFEAVRRTLLMTVRNQDSVHDQGAAA